MRQVLELDRRFRRIDNEYGTARLSWNELLAHRCVVVLGEGGTGKTTEFQAQSKQLRRDGDIAFFCRLHELSESTLQAALGPDDDAPFAEWITSPREAFFFLDSLDEAKLRGKFLGRALANLRRGLGNAWTRARLVVSSRDSDWLPSDRLEVERAIGEREPLLVVQLEPLDRTQFDKLAVNAGVADVSALWQAIQDQAAQDLAARPADVTWISEYWIEKRQIVDLTDLLEHNLEKRCRERAERSALPTLDPATALCGARALAGLAILERRWSFLVPEGEPDLARRHESLDTEGVLHDWQTARVQALLRLPLFDEGCYGRVYLHHRTAHEYLAAKWINELLDHGWPYRDLEALLFRTTVLGTTVPAHLHAVAAWVAASRSELAERLIRDAPELLLLHGDPSRLPESTRRKALHAYAERYANRGYLGQWFEPASLRRFACPALAPLIVELLSDRSRPLELRTTLLELIENGMSTCVDQALAIAGSADEPTELRARAIRAVGAAGSSLDRQKLLAAIPIRAPATLVATAMVVMYPRYLEVPMLVDLALRARSSSTSNEVVWQWRSLLNAAPCNECYALLLALHARLGATLHAAAERQDLWSFELLANTLAEILSKYITPDTDRFAPELEQAIELLRRAHSEPWFFEKMTDVESALRALPLLRRRLFWLGVEARSRGSVQLDSWRSLPYRPELWQIGPSDIDWLRDDALSARPLPERLLAFATLARVQGDLSLLEDMATQESAFADHLSTLRELERHRDENPVLQKHRALVQAQEHERERTREANFRILQNNLAAISDGTHHSFLIHLLQESKVSHSSYAEVSTSRLHDRYSAEVAEAAESGWRAFWRHHTPQLRHERAKLNEISYLDIMGLVGVSLELKASADTLAWSRADAALAARYASLELNGLPLWLEALAVAHPDAVREGIEPALRSEYDKPDASGHSSLIGSLSRSGPALRAALGPIVSDCLSRGMPGSASVAESCLEFVARVPGSCPPPPLDVVEARCRAAVSTSPDLFSAWMRHWLEREPEAAVNGLIEVMSELDRKDNATATKESSPPLGQVENEKHHVRARDLVQALLAGIENSARDSRMDEGAPPAVLESLARGTTALLHLLTLAYKYFPQRYDGERHSLEMTRITRQRSAQWARDRLLSLALHPEKGLSIEHLHQLSDHPHMSSARDTILVAVEGRAAHELAGESPASSNELMSLYLTYGTGALDYLRRQRDPRAVTTERLLQDLVAVGQAVVDRIAGLPRKEDEISDWLLELLRQRLHHHGVEVGDQARGGFSASGRGPGERDAVLRYQGRIVATFEALRMSACDKGVITSHLDKLPNYDVVGAPVFVVVYYQGTAFDSWVARYTETVEHHQLRDWTRCEQQSHHELDNLGIAQRVLRFVYKTSSGEQLVFHVLLDLGSLVKSAAPAKADVQWASGRIGRGSARLRPGDVVDVEQSVSAPADGAEPGSRGGSGAREAHELGDPVGVAIEAGRVCPAVEPGGARCRVDPAACEAPAALGGVVAGVEQDVAQGVADLSWGTKAAGVVALGEQPTGALEVSVESASEPCAEGLHGRGEVAAGVSLDEEMDVTAEDAVVDDAEGVGVTERDEVADEGDGGTAA